MLLIELLNVKKSYQNATGQIEALKGVSLKVERSDIYGVIGYSGAGKSTLIRCINLLEHPDSGQVLLSGNDITGSSQSQLEKTRQQIGMIFQHFNLLRSKTVFENIAFPLRYLRKSKQEIQQKVKVLLQLVDLSDKADCYPSQLSGGQKQRVAIARALANDPQILLSDEATSALDPQTTDSILQLLLELNRRLGLTIVIVTHEMHVVQEICNKVAVMENGLIVEQGDTFEVFSHPQTKTTRCFTASLFREGNVEKLIEQIDQNLGTFPNRKLLHLLFVGPKANNAYISHVIKRFEVEVSILYGSIELVQSRPIGSLFVAISGDEIKILAAMEYLKTEGVSVHILQELPSDDQEEVVV